VGEFLSFKGYLLFFMGDCIILHGRLYYPLSEIVLSFMGLYCHSWKITLSFTGDLLSFMGDCIIPYGTSYYPL
jgi:hypothetical protein